MRGVATTIVVDYYDNFTPPQRGITIAAMMIIISTTTTTAAAAAAAAAAKDASPPRGQRIATIMMIAASRLSEWSSGRPRG